MISIIEQPNAVNFSKNPIVVKLETNNRILVTGVSARLKFVVPEIADGDTFTLAWGSKSLLFTAVATPDDSGLQVSYYPGIIGLEAYALILVEELTKNYDISEDFFVAIFTDGVNYGIDLLSKNTGSIYSLTLTDAITGMTEALNTGGVTEVRRPNFKMVLEITIATNKITLEQEPDIEEQCFWDISGQIDPYLELFKPDYDLDEISASESFKYFSIRYAEEFGDSPQVQRMNSLNSEGYIALLGGESKEDYPDSTFIADGTRFLTHQPLSKVIGRQQKEFLYWPNYPNDSISFNVQMYFSDGTSQTILIDNQADDDLGFKVWVIPAGFTQLGLDTYEVGKTIIKYIIWMVGNGTPDGSEVRTYILDTKYYHTQKVFHYFNSLTGFETLRTTGENDRGVDIDYDLNLKILSPSHSSSEGELFKSDIKFTSPQFVSTGFIKKNQRKAIQEILFSEEVYEDIGGRWIPIIITTKKDKFSDDDPTASMRFEYYYANVNNQYSSL